MPPRQGELPSKPELDLGAGSTSQKEGRLSSIRKVTNRLVSTGKNVLVTENTRWLFYNLVTVVFTIGLIVSVSIFTYGAFYFAYMPAQVHEENVNFQFSPCESDVGPCSFPNATLQLDKKNHRFMIGQPYKIGVKMEVPDSITNQELGMFMSCLKIIDDNDKAVATSCKSSMLEFRQVPS